MPGRLAWADADIGDRRDSLRKSGYQGNDSLYVLFLHVVLLFFHLKQKSHAKKSSHFVVLFVDEHLLRPVLGLTGAWPSM